jgi:hypothetical protein
MMRRDFLRLGASGAMMGAAGTGVSGSAAASEAMTPAAGTPAILKTYGPEEHRRRLQNVGFCEGAIRSCMKKHLVTDYLPGQACYSLGEYPCRKVWDPDEYDEQELDKLRDHGIELIQLFDDWNDSLRLFGGHKLTALNPAGFHRFIDMVHARGMKVITYFSTGFIQITDPDFRPEWSREGDVLVLGYWQMARCSPASAGWRAYLLPQIMQVMDEYGLDGIYNDGGYVANSYNRPLPPTKDEVLAFEESPDYDGALTDMLMLLYGEVKRRGGIVKLHMNAADQPMTRGAKVYDYLWVGEGVSNADGLRNRVKDYPPYVVPCIDMAFASVDAKDDPYLHSIPYMQFPVLTAGRPFTGERAMIPGVEYPNPDDFWMKRCREAWKRYQENPDDLHTYSAWDAFPPRPETRPTHAHWLKQYQPMVQEGTWVWIEVGDCDLFAEPPHKDVVASVFANQDVYLVLANYGAGPTEIAFRDAYVPVDDANVAPEKRWKLGGRSLRILRRDA